MNFVCTTKKGKRERKTETECNKRIGMCAKQCQRNEMWFIVGNLVLLTYQKINENTEKKTNVWDCFYVCVLWINFKDIYIYDFFLSFANTIKVWQQFREGKCKNFCQLICNLKSAISPWPITGLFMEIYYNYTQSHWFGCHSNCLWNHITI